MKAYLLLFILAVFAESLYIYVGEEEIYFNSPICPRYNASFNDFEVDLVIHELSKNKSKYADKFVLFNAIYSYSGLNAWVANYTALGFFFVERDHYHIAGATCTQKIHDSENAEGKSFIIGMILEKNYKAIVQHAKTNGTVDEHGNTLIRAKIILLERNVWTEVKQYLWVLVGSFLIIFFSVLFLAIYKLYWLLTGAKLEISVALVCLINIVIANIIRIIYFITGPMWFYDIVEDDFNIGFITGTWPFGLFNILLISLFWEELLSQSFKKKSFVRRYFKVWIGVCIAIFVLTLIPTVLMIVAQSRSLFDISVYLAVLIQLIIGSLNIIYSIINTVRFSSVLSKMDLATEKEGKKKKFRSASLSIIVANIGEFCFLLSVLSIIANIPIGFNTRIWAWSFMYVSLVICDLGIIFSFGLKTRQQSSRSRSKTKKSSH